MSIAVAVSVPAVAKVFGPEGIQLIHAGTQRRLTMPIPANTGRHPYRAMSKPAPKVPTAGPQRMAEITMPFANPQDQPLEEPKAGEVRLKVQAIGLNRAEV